MAIQWTDNLATGSAEIDAQHRMLFNRINAMMDACNQGKGRLEVQGALRFLEEYVVEHFSAEERWMTRFAYPAYEEHKAEHLEFIRKVDELKRQVNDEGAGLHTVIATNQLMVHWFVNHIRLVDTKLGAFLGKRGV
jgi:hemerythrin